MNHNEPSGSSRSDSDATSEYINIRIAAAIGMDDVDDDDEDDQDDDLHVCIRINHFCRFVHFANFCLFFTNFCSGTC